MDGNTKVTVKIAGREYTMRGTAPKEHIYQVAAYVDLKMTKIRERQPELSTSMLSVLTAINLADEVLKQAEEKEELANELKELKASIKKQDRERPPIYDVSKKGRR